MAEPAQDSPCDTKPVKEEFDVFDPPYQNHESPIRVLRNMLEGDVSLTTLEKAASTADDFLTIIDPILDQAARGGVEVKHLVDQVNALRSTPTGVELVVGLFGASGVGKTSLANALLDEESILITNTKEACTATVTSVRYNSDTDPEKLYMAKTIYVDPAVWRRDIALSQRDSRHEREGEEIDLAAV